MQFFKSNGKLLLTGEYIVLDGAKALALPTKKSQTLTVRQSKLAESIPILSWISLNDDGTVWFSGTFKLSDFKPIISNHKVIANTLQQILLITRKLNKSFLSQQHTVEVTTKLDFNKNWGLGSSSTLINNIAQWAKIDPFTLLKTTFGGSGYDIAAAQSTGPIVYQLKNNIPYWETAKFDPPFKDQLFFVYLGKKQNSREAIENYKQFQIANFKFQVFDEITTSMLSCKTLSNFESLIKEHEENISKLIKQPPIKQQLFSDYTGSIKSLGAWGGDFILATGSNKEYFQNKGYNVIFSYADLIR